LNKAEQGKMCWDKNGLVAELAANQKSIIF